MAKVTVELDDKTMERLAQASRVTHVSVEDILRRQAEEVVRYSALDIPNASHRKILGALSEPDDPRETPRDALHNRERDRAEIYAETRKKLLALIDNTAGDMGAQGWSRASQLYGSVRVVNPFRPT